MPRPEWIEVGRVTRAHGVSGEVRVSPSTDNPDRFVPGARLFARPEGRAAARAVPDRPPDGPEAPAGERRPLEIVSIRGAEGSPIVAFAGVRTRDEAAELCGWVLEVPAGALPELEPGEFYPFDLEGLTVRLPDGSEVGRVVELLDAPANDVLVVRLEADGREHLLPFVEEAVPDVCLGDGYLVVNERFLAAE